MTATRALLPDFNVANPLYAGASVTVYEADQDGVATATLADIYDGLTGAGTLGNPLTLDSDGKWQQPPYVEVAVIMSISGGSVADHDTGVAGPPGSFTGAATFTEAPDTDYGLTSFTATVLPAGGLGGHVVRASYYKLGRMVHWMVNARLQTPGGAGSDEVYIQTVGLPTPDFPSATGVGTPSWAANVTRYAGLSGLSGGPLFGKLDAAGEIHFVKAGQSTGNAALTVADVQPFGTREITVSGQYVSAS